MALMGLTDFADHYPEAPLGRHAPAPRARPRLRGQARVPADGRAVRRARRADAHRRCRTCCCRCSPTEGKTVMLITHSVDEAIYLSSRIVVVTARPARVRERSSTCRSRIRARVGARGPRASPSCARGSASLVMEEYAAQARQAVPARLAAGRRPRIPAKPTRPHHRPHTGDDHDPSPQNRSSGRRRRRRCSARRLRRRTRSRRRAPSCASATCTRPRSTARSGSASNRARGPSAASTSS